MVIKTAASDKLVVVVVLEAQDKVDQDGNEEEHREDSRACKEKQLSAKVSLVALIGTHLVDRRMDRFLCCEWPLLASGR
jgi:hypothetical protein